MQSAYAAAYPELYRRHWWWRVRERILLERIALLLKEAPHEATILDVGCGAGLFFDALQRFGRVEGIESDKAAVENSGPWRHHIFQGELDSSFRPSASYDAILMLDVLEHVPHPEQLLREAKARLKPTGRILITVPAFKWLWTTHDDINQHLRRYTATEIHRTIDAAGLAVAESTYLFQSLIIPKLLVRGREAVLAKRDTVPAVPVPMLNALLQAWFRTEFAIAGWLPFGTSLMVVARLP